MAKMAKPEDIKLPEIGNILLVGSTGSVGSVLVEELEKLKDRGEWDVGEIIAPEQEDLDYFDEEQIHDYLMKFHPEIIYLVGAYTNVDKAEDEAQKLCYNINVEGIQNFMENFLEWRKEGCGEDRAGRNDCDGKGSEDEGNIESESGDDSKSYNPVVIYISTDMVGSGDSALEEDENVWEPLVAVNEYGKSKALAEKLIKDMHEEYAHLFDYRILRICFPIASWRKGSIFTLLKKTVAKGQEVRLVEDEVQTLTYVPHTAYNSILMAKFGENGVYHDAMLGDDEGVGGNDKYGCSPFVMGNYFAELMGWDVDLIGRMKHQDMYDKGWWSAPRGLSAELKVEKGLEIEGWKSGDMKEILDEYAEEMQD